MSVSLIKCMILAYFFLFKPSSLLPGFCFTLNYIYKICSRCFPLFIKFAERLLVCVGVELASQAALNLAKREFFEYKMHFLQREVDDLDIPANYIMITIEMIAI